MKDAPETTFTGMTGGIAVEGKECAAEVFDGQGRLILKETVRNGTLVPLPAGFYIVRNGKDNTKVMVK